MLCNVSPLPFVPLHGYCKEILKEPEARFSCLEDDDLYLAASLLNPSHKLKWLKRTGSDAVLESKIKNSVLAVMDQVAMQNPKEIKKVSLPQKRKSLFDFGENETEDLTVTSNSAQTELGKYLVNADSANDPTAFWKTHKEEFPRLVVTAQSIFAAPASTAADERIFSTAGYILSPRRLRTSDFNFENLLFANLNRNVLQIATSKKR